MATGTIGRKGTGNQRTKKDLVICPICDETIKDAVGKKEGEDAIECNGSCSTWLHRRCAGLNKAAFNLASKSQSSPFFCPQCRLDKQEMEIQSLKKLVTNLAGQLTLACDELNSLKQNLIASDIAALQTRVEETAKEIGVIKSDQGKMQGVGSVALKSYAASVGASSA